MLIELRFLNDCLCQVEVIMRFAQGIEHVLENQGSNLEEKRSAAEKPLDALGSSLVNVVAILNEYWESSERTEQLTRVLKKNYSRIDIVGKSAQKLSSLVKGRDDDSSEDEMVAKLKGVAHHLFVEAQIWKHRITGFDFETMGATPLKSTTWKAEEAYQKLVKEFEIEALPTEPTAH